ncbi:MAG TPA: energy transducer TonB, partial [Candidatus Acidoferrales bacterium]|nr:energy transducer TonB [Candidatus Acidoferrales bacterium]
KDRVLDLLFRSDTGTSPFLTKMTLRYGDSDSQLVVLTYLAYPVRPGGQAEVISYTITGMGGDNLSQFISKMAAQNSSVTDQEIAAKLKVEVKRSPIRYEALERLLEDLRAMRVSPMLASRLAVDEFSEYQFWYNTWQESVHYVITGPFGNDPQDQLGRWMMKFRDNLPNLLKGSLGPNPAKPGMPSVTSASVPLYPRITQQAHIEGVVRLRISTDGNRVASVGVQSGQPMLAQAAQENVKTWQFEPHSPTTFDVTFRYNLLPSKCDAECSCDSAEKPSVLLQLPIEVEVNAKELTVCDPASTKSRQ